METWTLTWTKLAPLKTETVSTIPDSTPSVYRLSYKDEDGSFYVFYVGQAIDIKTRLLQHLSPAEENVCIRNFISTKECFFRYAQISEDYVRAAIEKQAYSHYHPTCNTKVPEGRIDIQGNLTN